MSTIKSVCIHESLPAKYKFVEMMLIFLWWVVVVVIVQILVVPHIKFLKFLVNFDHPPGLVQKQLRWNLHNNQHLSWPDDLIPRPHHLRNFEDGEWESCVQNPKFGSFHCVKLRKQTSYHSRTSLTWPDYKVEFSWEETRWRKTLGSLVN